MAQASTSRRIPAWAGTGRELQETIRALREHVLPDARLSVSIRSLLAPERETTVDDLTTHLPNKEPFQIVVEIEEGDGRGLLVVLGPDLPAPATVGGDDSEEELSGNIITAEASTSDEANRVANQALEVLRRGIPRWGELKQKRHMNVLRLENLAGLTLVAVGFLASLIVVWPLGWFFGLLVSLVLLLVGLEVVERLFPPFELHAGRPLEKTMVASGSSCRDSAGAGHCFANPPRPLGCELVKGFTYEGRSRRDTLPLPA